MLREESPGSLAADQHVQRGSVDQPAQSSQFAALAIEENRQTANSWPWNVESAASLGTRRGYSPPAAAEHFVLHTIISFPYFPERMTAPFADADRAQMGRSHVFDPLRDQTDSSRAENVKPALAISVDKTGASLREETSQEFGDRTSGPARPRGIIDVFVKTCRRWRLGEDEQLLLLGYGSASDIVGKLVLAGTIQPRSRDEAARIRLVVEISLGLGILFGQSVEAENHWLRNPRTVLHDTSPLDFMLEGDMSHLSVVAGLVQEERGL